MGARGPPTPFGEHLISSGLSEIINIRASINLGLSPELKAAFPLHVPVVRPLVETTEIPHSQWVVGFTSGEGCFYVVTSPSVTSKVGFNVRLRFIISQHIRDEKLMTALVAYFNCGVIEINKNMVYFKVTNFSDILEKVIPVFKENGLVGIKQKDFNCWSEVAAIMKTKGHLQIEGAERIKEIKSNMNKSRDLDEKE